MQRTSVELPLTITPEFPAATCAICATPSMLKCAYCNTGPTYCSNAHFSLHWPIHGPLCDRSANDASAPNIPKQSSPTTCNPTASITSSCMMPVDISVSGVACYVLHDQAPAPAFANLQCYTVTIGGQHPRVMPNLSDFFQQGYGSLVMHFDYFKNPMPQPLHFFYCAASYSGRRNFNSAVAKLAMDGPRRGRWLSWPGTIVVFKYKNARCNAYDDFTEADVAHVRGFFDIFANIPCSWSAA